MTKNVFVWAAGIRVTFMFLTRANTHKVIIQKLRRIFNKQITVKKQSFLELLKKNFKLKNKNYETYYRSARVQLSNKF